MVLGYIDPEDPCVSANDEDDDDDDDGEEDEEEQLLSDAGVVKGGLGMFECGACAFGVVPIHDGNARVGDSLVSLISLSSQSRDAVASSPFDASVVARYVPLPAASVVAGYVPLPAAPVPAPVTLAELEAAAGEDVSAAVAAEREGLATKEADLIAESGCMEPAFLASKAAEVGEQLEDLHLQPAPPAAVTRQTRSSAKLGVSVTTGRQTRSSDKPRSAKAVTRQTRSSARRRASSKASFSAAIAADPKAAAAEPSLAEIEADPFKHPLQKPFKQRKFIKLPKRALTACNGTVELQLEAMQLFKLASWDQMSVLRTCDRFSFLQVWPCTASVGMTAVQTAKSAAKFSDRRTKGGRLKKQCPFCDKSAVMIDRHIKQHLGVCSVCLVPGCGRVFTGADTNLTKHAKSHAAGGVVMNAKTHA
jgi:hypothetical protein